MYTGWAALAPATGRAGPARLSHAEQPWPAPASAPTFRIRTPRSHTARAHAAQTCATHSHTHHTPRMHTHRACACAHSWPPRLPPPPGARCDVDIRKDLYGGVVLTGGTAGFVALRDRLEKEVTDLAPQMAKVKASAGGCCFVFRVCV